MNIISEKKPVKPISQGKKNYIVVGILALFSFVAFIATITFWWEIGLAKGITAMLFLLSIWVLPVYLEEVPDRELTAKYIFRVWMKNYLRLLHEVLEYVQKKLVNAMLLGINVSFIVVLAGMLTLYLFMYPDGLAGIIASYLVAYSQATGQGDFTTIYAIFSAAIVMSILLVISFLMVLHNVFKDDPNDPEENPEENII